MSVSTEAAAQLDTAIDTLLHDEGSSGPAPETELLATARLLRDVLPRFHPRFGFDELLASRLSAPKRNVARRSDQHDVAPQSQLIPFPAALDLSGGQSAAMERTADRRRRGLVAGGAIASGVSIAIPIAGAAVVVWRRARSSSGLF